MRSVGAYEAKTHLPGLLDRVALGEQIIITRHGVPVAVLRPIDDRPAEDPRLVIDKIMAFRRGRRLDGISLRELIEEGRR